MMNSHEIARRRTRILSKAGQDRRCQTPCESFARATAGDCASGNRNTVGKGQGIEEGEHDKIQGAEGTMNAVLYARVSSREQEREGYSIPAQASC